MTYHSASGRPQEKPSPDEDALAQVLMFVMGAAMITCVTATAGLGPVGLIFGAMAARVMPRITTGSGQIMMVTGAAVPALVAEALKLLAQLLAALKNKLLGPNQYWPYSIFNGASQSNQYIYQASGCLIDELVQIADQGVPLSSNQIPIIINEMIHVLAYAPEVYEFNSDMDSVKEACKDSATAVNELVLSSMKSYVRIVGEKDYNIRKKEETNYEKELPIYEMYLPFVFSHSTKRRVGYQDISTGEITYESQYFQDGLTGKLEEHHKQRVLGAKLCYMLYFGNEKAKKLRYSSLKEMYSEDESKKSARYKEVFKHSTYGMWGKWYDPQNGWHRGIDIEGGYISDCSDKQLYAICDGIIIQKTSYYFNVYIPERIITLTYMHLLPDTKIFKPREGLFSCALDRAKISDAAQLMSSLRKFIDDCQVVLDFIENTQEIKESAPKYLSVKRTLEKIVQNKEFNSSSVALLQKYVNSRGIVTAELRTSISSAIRLFRENIPYPVLLKGDRIGIESNVATGPPHTHIEINSGYFTAAIKRPTNANYDSNSLYQVEVCDIRQNDPNDKGFSKNPFSDIEWLFKNY